VFKNGTLHVTGAYSLDTSDFVIKAFVESLNFIASEPFSYRAGRVLLANYRTTLGLRLCLRSVAAVASENGHVPWLEARECAVVVKMLVEQERWATARIFATGSCAISVPCCGSLRAQVGAFSAVVSFLHALLRPVSPPAPKSEAR